jgi:hypothetical protein
MTHESRSVSDPFAPKLVATARIVAALAIRRSEGYLPYTHLAVRHQRRFPPPKVATVISQAIP